jgi:hypothetical protein
MEELSLEDVSNKILSYPPGTYFSTPASQYDQVKTNLTASKCISKLEYYTKYWSLDSQPLTFYVYEESFGRAWNSEWLKYDQNALIIGIGMTNEVIKEFNPRIAGSLN